MVFFKQFRLKLRLMVKLSSLSNVAAITNKKDRPGMITVSSLPNGKYIATYEVVNRPSISKNNAIVYCKFSLMMGLHGTKVA